MSTTFPRRALNYTAVNADPKAREVKRSAVARAKERLAATQLQLAQEKRRLRNASAREQGIREGEVGRVIWDLVAQGKLDHVVIDLIRTELRERLSDAQASAFQDTIFE
jgi:hypothetical protein